MSTGRRGRILWMVLRIPELNPSRHVEPLGMALGPSAGVAAGAAGVLAGRGLALSMLVTALIERGATPCIFFEGTFTSRLEYLLEFPKGKLLARFDRTDIFKAKEILKDHVCIEGNVPSSLLQIGSLQDVREHCKKLIDLVGKGGVISSLQEAQRMR